MLEKLKAVEARYLEMAERASQPEFYNDPAAAAKLLKEQKELEPVVTAYREYRKTEEELDNLLEAQRSETDEEMKQFCQDEYAAGKKRLAELEQQMKVLLLPRDPNDEKSVIMESLCRGQNVNLRECYAHSFCLSADVTAAYDPNFDEVYERRNSAYLNYGIGLCKYTGAGGKSGASDASAEIVGFVRKLFNDEGVLWQMAEMGKTDAGGGGTVAKYMLPEAVRTSILPRLQKMSSRNVPVPGP